MFSLFSVQNSNGCVTVALSGTVREDSLPEIGRLIANGEQGDTKVKLDLSEVTLIDRVAARFFAKQLERGIELIECPLYLRGWILREVRHEQKREF